VIPLPERQSEKYYRDTARYYEPFASRPDEPFFREIAKRYGSPILELGSGTGRISLMLAEKGYDIIGVELSPEMLEIAEEKLQKLPYAVRSRVTFHRGDITDFHLGQRFPLIFIPSVFKFLLTTEDQLACLRCARDHLREGGVFILDLYPGEVHDDDESYTTYPAEIDGSTVTKSYKSTNDLDARLRRTEVVVEIFQPTGEVEWIETESLTALMTTPEADELLALSGLETVEEYGGWDFSPYRPSSWRRILVLRTTED
jgi:SAM-dependent methyltransferase